MQPTRARLGFRRQFNWHVLGAALSLALIALSGVFLFRFLHDLDVARVIEALRQTPRTNLLAAVGFVGCAYFTLTCYDFFALRTIGIRHIPYRIAALTSMTSFAIGHNLGATAFTTAAVRYRMYSSHGLGLLEVAKLCFLTGLTFWLGNVTALGIGLMLRPEAASAVDQFPAWVNRSLGAAALAVLAAYLVWVWRSPPTIGHNGWSVTLPNGPRTLIQVLIGVADLVFCSLVMYMLVPASDLDVISLAVIVISATLLGFLSHAPGALGVFDAAMLLGLQGLPKEEVVAALLLYRLLYLLMPFLLALLVLLFFTCRGVRARIARTDRH